MQAGDDAELSCKYVLDREKVSNLFVKWWWTGHDGENEFKKQIFQKIGHNKGQISKQFHNISIIDEDTILLSNLEPEHSGLYECEVFAYPSEVRKSLSMVIYTEGTGPKLQITDIEEEGDEDDNDDDDDDDDMVLVECEATGVAPTPEFVISMNGVPQNDTESIRGPVDSVYNITGKVIIAKELADGSEFTCELFFEDQTVPHPVYLDSFVYRSDGDETTTEELTTSTHEPDDDEDDDDDDDYLSGDSGIRVDSTIVWLTLLIAIALDW